MTDVSRSPRTRARALPVSADKVPHLHVVHGDAYPDWESVYRENVDPALPADVRAGG